MDQPSIKDLLLTISGQLKILCRDKSEETVTEVNKTLDLIGRAFAGLSKGRLLPLVQNGPNDKLANLLAELLVEDASQAEDGARASLTILTGIQAFQDSGGDARTVEIAWRPIIIARQLLKEHGEDKAWEAAAKRAGELLAVEQRPEAELYERVALMLKPDIKNEVDNPT